MSRRHLQLRKVQLQLLIIKMCIISTKTAVECFLTILLYFLTCALKIGKQYHYWPKNVHLIPV